MGRNYYRKKRMQLLNTVEKEIIEHKNKPEIGLGEIPSIDGIFGHAIVGPTMQRIDLRSFIFFISREVGFQFFQLKELFWGDNIVFILFISENVADTSFLLNGAVIITAGSLLPSRY